MINEKIVIKKNPNGDTRTAQGEVDFDTFSKSNDMHIRDVSNIMNFFADMCEYSGQSHDYTKKEFEQKFYNEFTFARKNNTDFRDSEWYKIHIKTERHHINDFQHEDVDLIDVLEMIADCTSAGLARSGNIREIMIDKDVLYKAFKNTCLLVKDVCVLEE